MTRQLSRRAFVAGGAAVVGAAALPAGHARAASQQIPPADYRITNGRIKQSVMGWCYKPIPTEELIEVCHRMGMPAMEGIDRKYYPKVRARGMMIALVGSHGFKIGPFNRDNHKICLQKLREGIDVAVQYGAPSVITFTGYREPGISDEQGNAQLRRLLETGRWLCRREGDHPLSGTLEHAR